MQKFLKRILILGLIVAGLQASLGQRENVMPHRIRNDVEALCLEQDIVFFCDSSNWVCSDKDTDRRRISEFLEHLLSGQRVLAIDDAAWQMDTHLAFCRYIAASKKKPKTIIISINLRTFSSEWGYRPGYQFEQEQFFLSAGPARVLLKPLKIFKAIKWITAEEFDNTPVYCDEKLVGTAKDFSVKGRRPTSELVRKIFIFHYMYPLKPSHWRLQAMLNIIKILRSLDIEFVFYITPVDVQKGEAYLPGQFRNRVRKNAEVIKTLLREQGVDVLDLSQSVPSVNFSYGTYPNEHLDQYGRAFVAKHLAKMFQEKN